MNKRVYLVFFIIFLISSFFYFQNKQTKENELTTEQDNSEEYVPNLIQGVSYESTDEKGNVFQINAETGEIDTKESNIIFLKKVKAVVQLENSEKIKITSDFGKYNIDNFDTIFSKNVKIEYLDNIINGQYVDFSIVQNYMQISKNVTYTSKENKLNADVVEIELDTKNTKIFMYEDKDQVNLKKIN